MKLSQLHEARYYGDPPWVRDAFSIAEWNLGRANSSVEERYWQGYADWLKEHKKRLQVLWKAFKDDRDRYLNHMDQDDHQKRRRDLNAENWSSTIDQHDYREYIDFVSEFIPREPASDNNVLDDYLQYATNTMLDSLGSLKDEG